ncbi:Protein TIFY 5A [Triticum urartu]|nr:protein TIFY 5 [Triticum urartu]EMS66242.1 Protein TIFY 5A [Triticum urartu]
MAGGSDAGMGACGADGLELSLRLGSPTAAPAPAPAPARRNLTIVYDRRVLCAVDVVELQAMAIISMANQETTGRITDMDDAGIAQGACRPARAQTRASPDHGCIEAPTPLDDQGGLSMKRSLQRFLEKRKARASAASPYVVHRPARAPRS